MREVWVGLGGGVARGRVVVTGGGEGARGGEFMVETNR